MKDLKQQVILGTLMGRGFISKPKRGNCFLTITEPHDLNWLKHKVDVIGGDKPIFKTGKRWIWKSNPETYWNETYEEFYLGGCKRISMSVLDLFIPYTLAVWFFDKGYFLSNYRIALRTTSFGLNGNEVIHQYFNEVGMPCEIRKERNTGRIVFTREGTSAFRKMVEECAPPFMFYRFCP